MTTRFTAEQLKRHVESLRQGLLSEPLPNPLDQLSSVSAFVDNAAITRIRQQLQSNAVQPTVVGVTGQILDLLGRPEMQADSEQLGLLECIDILFKRHWHLTDDDLRVSNGQQTCTYELFISIVFVLGSMVGAQFPSAGSAPTRLPSEHVQQKAIELLVDALIGFDRLFLLKADAPPVSSGLFGSTSMQPSMWTIMQLNEALDTSSQQTSAQFFGIRMLQSCILLVLDAMSKLISSSAPGLVSPIASILTNSDSHAKLLRVSLYAAADLLRRYLEHLSTSTTFMTQADSDSEKVDGKLPNTMQSAANSLNTIIPAAARLRVHMSPGVRRGVAYFCNAVFDGFTMIDQAEDGAGLVEVIDLHAIIRTAVILSHDGIDDVANDAKDMLFSVQQNMTLTSKLTSTDMNGSVIRRRIMRASSKLVSELMAKLQSPSTTQQEKLNALRIVAWYTSLGRDGSTSDEMQYELDTVDTDELAKCMVRSFQAAASGIAQQVQSPDTKLLTNSFSGNSISEECTELGKLVISASVIETVAQRMNSQLGSIDIFTPSSSSSSSTTSAIDNASELLSGMAVFYRTMTSLVTTQSQSRSLIPLAVSSMDEVVNTVRAIQDSADDEFNADPRRLVVLQGHLMDAVSSLAPIIGRRCKLYLAELLMPILVCAGSIHDSDDIGEIAGNRSLKSRAMNALQGIATACGHSSVVELNSVNADYIVNSVSLVLRRAPLAALELSSDHTSNSGGSNSTPTALLTEAQIEARAARELGWPVVNSLSCLRGILSVSGSSAFTFIGGIFESVLDILESGQNNVAVTMCVLRVLLGIVVAARKSCEASGNRSMLPPSVVPPSSRALTYSGEEGTDAIDDFIVKRGEADKTYNERLSTAKIASEKSIDELISEVQKMAKSEEGRHGEDNGDNEPEMPKDPPKPPPTLEQQLCLKAAMACQNFMASSNPILQAASLQTIAEAMPVLGSLALFDNNNDSSNTDVDGSTSRSMRQAELGSVGYDQFLPYINVAWPSLVARFRSLALLIVPAEGLASLSTLSNSVSLTLHRPQAHQLTQRPSVHSSGSTAGAADQAFVLLKAGHLIRTMALYATDFLTQRFTKDLWPAYRAMLLSILSSADLVALLKLHSLNPTAHLSRVVCDVLATCAVVIKSVTPLKPYAEVYEMAQFMAIFMVRSVWRSDVVEQATAVMEAIHDMYPDIAWLVLSKEAGEIAWVFEAAIKPFALLYGRPPRDLTERFT
ncbi:hypothetical protein GQ42DRAFT_180726 [Ramicandelaber brevisporus]|nr:hypothetical protein GQ42DRAFT_180726 [Ramicandelaber brevisporus]